VLERVSVTVGLELGCPETEFVKDLVSDPDVVIDPETVGVNGNDVAIGLIEVV